MVGAVLLSAGVLYAGAAPGEWRSPYQMQRLARELAREADVMVLAEAGEVSAVEGGWGEVRRQWKAQVAGGSRLHAISQPT
ncbi:MAG: hypothetical protein LOD90_04185 [Symbiobacteriaceae bacterium]